MSDKALMLYVKTQNKLNSAQEKVEEFLHDEEGDTNFLSVLVLLGIALALAGVFLGFKDKILTWVDTNIGDFFNLKGGKST